MMKRTFVVPDDKDTYYEKFKELVPEVSGELVSYIVSYVDRHEALQAGMTEQTVHKGTHDLPNDIFHGTTSKFHGVLLAGGEHCGLVGTHLEVYLTKKSKFLVYSVVTNKLDETAKYDFQVFDSYGDMKEKAQLSEKLLRDCEKYLSLKSNIRTYEVLDI